MQEFVLSGQAVDMVLAIIALEFVGLLALRRRTWKRSAVDLIFALMPGVLLLVALRLTLTGAEWHWIAASIASSFPFHLVDLARRRG